MVLFTHVWQLSQWQRVCDVATLLHVEPNPMPIKSTVFQHFDSVFELCAIETSVLFLNAIYSVIQINTMCLVIAFHSIYFTNVSTKRIGSNCL